MAHPQGGKEIGLHKAAIGLARHPLNQQAQQVITCIAVVKLVPRLAQHVWELGDRAQDILIVWRGGQGQQRLVDIVAIVISHHAGGVVQQAANGYPWIHPAQFRDVGADRII